MKCSDDFDWFALERLYDEGRELFHSGKHDEALNRFKRIYEETLDLRDVNEILDDYYTLPKEQWVAKYMARFKARPSLNQPVAVGREMNMHAPKWHFLNRCSAPLLALGLLCLVVHFGIYYRTSASAFINQPELYFRNVFLIRDSSGQAIREVSYATGLSSYITAALGVASLCCGLIGWVKARGRRPNG
jgi:hypothetical protein